MSPQKSVSGFKVLYEDNHLIVVVKPRHIPVQADESGDPDLQQEIKQYIGEKYNKPGNVFTGIVHRLDRPVGGVMVFARTSKAASRLSDEIRRNSMKKTYLAVVQGRTPDSGTWTHWLLKDERTNMVSAHHKEVPGSKKAILHFRRVGYKSGLSLVEIDLETGRPHQIRVQFLASGHPLWGDQRYNKQAVVGQHIALFAHQLSFTHPTTKVNMSFSELPPFEEPWILIRRE
jgi:23S rRNA pseudouridine1911/1915/1917 synthase